MPQSLFSESRAEPGLLPLLLITVSITIFITINSIIIIIIIITIIIIIIIVSITASKPRKSGPRLSSLEFSRGLVAAIGQTGSLQTNIRRVKTPGAVLYFTRVGYTIISATYAS